MIIPSGYEMPEDALHRLGSEKFGQKWTDAELEIIQRERVLARGEITYEEYPVKNHLIMDLHNIISRIYDVTIDLIRKLYDGDTHCVWVDRKRGRLLRLESQYWLRYDADQIIKTGIGMHPDEDVIGSIYIFAEGAEKIDVTPVIYETGAPGRRTSIHIVLPELRKRIEVGDVEPSISKQAAKLSAWLAATHPNAAPMTPKVVENNIRALWNAKGLGRRIKRNVAG